MYRSISERASPAPNPRQPLLEGPGSLRQRAAAGDEIIHQEDPDLPTLIDSASEFVEPFPAEVEIHRDFERLRGEIAIEPVLPCLPEWIRHRE